MTTVTARDCGTGPDPGCNEARGSRIAVSVPSAPKEPPPEDFGDLFKGVGSGGALDSNQLGEIARKLVLVHRHHRVELRGNLAHD